MLVVTLPSGGRPFHLGLRRWATPRCDVPGATSILGVGPFVAVKPDPPRSSRLPLHVSVLGSAYGKKPAVVHRGDEFHFKVRLRNPSSQPFRFERCPVYEVGGFFREGVDNELSQDRNQEFVLNCASVGTLDPGERVVFAMVIRVPRKAQLGRNFVNWVLAPRTYLPPFESAPVTVVR
jgi:hypothetical protein